MRTLRTAAAPMELGMLQRVEESRSAHGPTGQSGRQHRSGTEMAGQLREPSKSRPGSGQGSEVGARLAQRRREPVLGKVAGTGRAPGVLSHTARLEKSPVFRGTGRVWPQPPGI